MDQFKSKDQEAHLKKQLPPNNNQQMQQVRLPEIRARKEEPPVSQKPSPKDYYSYKSPNFKQ